MIITAIRLEVEKMDYIVEYLNSLRTDGRSPATIKGANDGLLRFEKCIGNKSLVKIDRSDIDKFILELSPTNTQRSISQAVGVVNRFYDFLVEDLEILDRNPIKRKAKRLDTGRTITNRPKRNFEEVRDYVRGIRNLRDQAMIALFLKTLVRNGELCALTLDDFDEDRGYLNVDKHYTHVGTEVLPGRKNKNITTIPLDDEMVRILRRYIKTRPKVESNAIFISRLKEPIGLDVGRRTVAGWAEKLNFSENGGKYSGAITPHYMRAFGTMEMEKRGMNPSVIQYIRGDVPDTTMAQYSRAVLHPEDIKKEYERGIFKFDL